MTRLGTLRTLRASRLALALSTPVLLLIPIRLEATPVGSFSLVGLGSVRFGASFTDWGTFESAYANCVVGPNPGACVIDGNTTGSVLVTAGTGDFGAMAGLSGSLKDLEDDFAPAGTPFVLDGFLTGLPGVSFTATSLVPGTGTLAGCTNNVGDVCTVPGSPLTITNLAGGSSSVTMTIRGVATDGSETLPFVGRFDTQVGQTSAQLVAQTGALGWFQSSYSADFEVSRQTVPEPTSLALIALAGAPLLGALRRRRPRG